MGIINNILTGEAKTEVIKLADEFSTKKSQNFMPLSSPDNMNAQEPTVDFEELEFSYRKDPINFNAINKSKQLIMAAGLRKIEHKVKSVVDKYQEFFDMIGDVGFDFTFEELMECIFIDQMIYGNAYIELVFDDEDKEIVDLALIDPKRIDYAKTNDKKVILDSRGRAVGYVVKMPWGTYGEGDKIPERIERNIKLDSREIFILAKRIAHFKLYPIGDRFYGIGLLEPGYTSAVYKRNIEKGQANSIYQRGFSPLVAYVGSERRIATPKDIDVVLDKLKKLNYNRYEAFPDWVRVEPIEMKQSDVVQDTLDYLRVNQIAPTGVPRAVATCSGEATNRSTLGGLQNMYEMTLEDIVKKTLSSFRKQILKRINLYNHFGGVPKFIWNEIRAEDTDNTIMQIIRIITAKASADMPKDFKQRLMDELLDLMGIENG